MPTRSPARWASAVAVLGTVIGARLATRVQPGLPYDEPAHWSTVLFYAREHRMPVLGDPGVAYEAQMGPVYYALSGLVVDIVGTGDESRAFFVLRYAGLCLIPLLAWLTYRLARSVHSDPWVAFPAAALIAVNPLMLLIGASIQNYYLSFVLIALTVLVAIPVVRRPTSSFLPHLGLGALIGVATLTKVVAAALLVALLMVYLLDRARPGPPTVDMGWLGAGWIRGGDRVVVHSQPRAVRGPDGRPRDGPPRDLLPPAAHPRSGRHRRLGRVGRRVRICAGGVLPQRAQSPGRVPCRRRGRPRSDARRGRDPHRPTPPHHKAVAPTPTGPGEGASRRLFHSPRSLPGSGTTS